ncbi:MAG: SDR family oxidoreductase [Bacteroidota bacterium]|nr:SDR family oxidoreductase [Bacteroidota bacterium]
MKLKNKVAVVTGASRGVGRAVAQRFAAEGAAVCLCARNGELLRSVSLEILSHGGKATFEQTDITDERQVLEFVAACTSMWSGIDILVNNAGVLGSRNELADYPLTDWQKVFAVNVTGVFLMTKYLIPHFNTGGSIINVSSSVGRTVQPAWGAYAVSKFALEGMTKLLAEELRSRNIRVNSINPGGVATEMRRLAFPQEDPNTLRKPGEILDPFVFLASDESLGITGRAFDAQRFRV